MRSGYSAMRPKPEAPGPAAIARPIEPSVESTRPNRRFLIDLLTLAGGDTTGPGEVGAKVRLKGCLTA